MSLLQTEYPLTLPLGSVDETGTLHREVAMRLATAGDELLPLKDPRVRQNEAYASVIILSRVVVKLGTLDMITTKVIEDLFARDFAYLNAMYDQINALDPDIPRVTCPSCKTEFETGGADRLGES